MQPPTFTIISASGILVPEKMYAGGSLESANGSYVNASPGAFTAQDVERPVLRLVVSD